MLVMADDAVNIGAARRERLAQRRKVLGLTQEDLACLLGVERSTVMRWERGENEPQPSIRLRLAKALRVPTDRLEALLASDGGLGGSGAEPGASRHRTHVVPQQLPAAVPDRR